MSLENEYENFEEKLFNDGIELLSNGHRMTYIFKYIRDRSTDDEMRKRIMERLTANNQVKEINQTRKEEQSKASRLTPMELGAGLLVIAFALFIMRSLWDSGWVSTLPLALIAFVLIRWNSKS